MTQLEIEAFLTILKTGSISAAADNLYVTQPALSRRIRALEQELGYELFERGKGFRSVTLTEAGDAFLPVAKKWLRVYHEAINISARAEKPILNLSSVGSVSTYLLPAVLRQMITEDAPCRLCFHQYHSYEAYGYVDSGMIDAALISDDMYHRFVLTTPAFEEPFVLIGGPDFPDVSSIHPSDLDPQKEIRLPWNPEFDAWHAHWFDASVSPKIQLDQMSLLEEFLTGELFSIVPLIVAQQIKTDHVRICQLKDGPPDEIIYCLTRHDSDPKKAALVRYFLTLLKVELCRHEGIRCFLTDFTGQEDEPS